MCLLHLSRLICKGTDFTVSILSNILWNITLQSVRNMSQSLLKLSWPKVNSSQLFFHVDSRVISPRRKCSNGTVETQCRRLTAITQVHMLCVWVTSGCLQASLLLHRRETLFFEPQGRPFIEVLYQRPHLGGWFKFFFLYLSYAQAFHTVRGYL